MKYTRDALHCRIALPAHKGSHQLYTGTPENKLGIVATDVVKDCMYCCPGHSDPRR